MLMSLRPIATWSNQSHFWMQCAVPGLKNAQYDNYLRTIGAVRDQMHVPGTGTVGIYRKIVWKTQHVDNTDHNKRAEMEAWLDKFFDCTGPTTNWVKKKPTLDHALQHFRALRSDIGLCLEPQGFRKGTEGAALYCGLTFKPPQQTAETCSVEEHAPDTPMPTLAGRHTRRSHGVLARKGLWSLTCVVQDACRVVVCYKSGKAGK